jgi:hypothetical protein
VPALGGAMGMYVPSFVDAAVFGQREEEVSFEAVQ